MEKVPYPFNFKKWFFGLIVLLAVGLLYADGGKVNKANERLVKKSIRSGPKSVRFNMDFPRAELSDVEANGRKYKKIVMPRSRAGMIDFGEGKPELPVKKILVRIPDGSNFTAAVSNLKTEFFEKLELAPKQYVTNNGGKEGKREFKRDDKFYKSSEWFPKRRRKSAKRMSETPDELILSAHTVNIRNQRYAEVTIALASYQPSSYRAEVVDSFDLDVYVTAGAGAATVPISSSFSEMAATGDYDLTDGASAPAAMTGSNPVPTLPEGVLPERYLIIYNDQYAGHPVFKEFIEWKRRKGYDVVTKSTGAIGGSKCTNTEISNYLKNLPDDQWPVYLLLVGNDNKWDGVQMHKRAVSYGIIYAWNDYYYSLRTYTQQSGQEDWDLDNTDGYSTDPNDWIDEYPDLMLGRIPAEDDATLTNILNKIMYMDRTPPVSSDHYQRSIMVGARGGGLSLPEPCSDAMAVYFENTYGDSKLEMAFHGSNYSAGQVITQSSPRTIWHNGYWQVSDIFPEETVSSNAAARDKLISEWNKGAAFVNYICHGGPEAWYWNNKGGEFWKADAAALSNKNKYSLVYDWSCSTADENGGLNLTQTLLGDTNGGAYAMMAAASAQFAGYQDYLGFGFLAGGLADFLSFLGDYPDSNSYPAFDNPPDPLMFTPGQAKRLGQMWWCSKLYSLETFPADTFERYALGPRCNRTAYKNMYLQTLYGDPESFFRFNQPSVLAVSHPATVALGANTVEVITEEGAMVCLYSARLGIQQAKIAGAGGIASFAIAPAASGAINVTASKYDRVPYEGGFSVAGNTAPQLSQSNIEALPVTTGLDYEYDLSGLAVDLEGDAVFFTKVSGPNWLGITDLGFCYGIAASADAGTNVFDVFVSDASGLGANLQMTAQVSTPPAPPDFEGWSATDLACHWSFDLYNGAITLDDSGNDRNGIVTGANWTDSAKVGGGMSLDGVDDEIKNAFASTEVWPEFTVCLWAKAATVNQPEWSGIFNNEGNGSDFQIDIDGAGSIRYRGTALSMSYGTETTDWVHLAVTCDGTTTTIYRDGVPVNSATVADTAFGCLQVGCNRGANVFFNGMIDDLYVYKRAFTADEIMALINWTLLTSPPARIEDVWVIAQSWLQNCDIPERCMGIDLDFNGTIDLDDFQLLAKIWMKGN